MVIAIMVMLIMIMILMITVIMKKMYLFIYLHSCIFIRTIIPAPWGLRIPVGRILCLAAKDD